MLPDRATDPHHWVKNHADYMYTYALSRINDEEQARDLVQETFLAAFADKGIAEQAEIDARNAEIEQKTLVKVARDAKLEELQQQAADLITLGLQDFDKNIAPTIALPVEVQLDVQP